MSHSEDKMQVRGHHNPLILAQRQGEGKGKVSKIVKCNCYLCFYRRWLGTSGDTNRNWSYYSWAARSWELNLLKGCATKVLFFI